MYTLLKRLIKYLILTANVHPNKNAVKYASLLIDKSIKAHFQPTIKLMKNTDASKIELY